LGGAFLRKQLFHSRMLDMRWYSLDSENDFRQVIETLVTNNSFFQNYSHPDFASDFQFQPVYLATHAITKRFSVIFRRLQYPTENLARDVLSVFKKIILWIKPPWNG